MHREEDKTKPKEAVRISSTSTEGDLTFRNLTEAEQEIFKGMTYNHYWVTIVEGRLVMVRRREEVPGPAEDEEMHPFWQRPVPGSKQLQLFDVKMSEPEFPRIIIQYLCGYGYTPEKYKYQVQLLESYGFECLRSRRGDDALFTEMWVLPGLWAAKGNLEEALKGFDLTSKKAMKAATDFLCQNASFGTLDVAFQRAAMVLD